MKKKNETPIHPVIEKIRKIIADRGLTQIVAAEFAGTSPSQFSKILGGGSSTKFMATFKFCNELRYGYY